jgi:site-specific recombinase XerD
MHPQFSITITDLLKLPVRVIKVNGLPKIIAGGTPVTPINTALARRVQRKGATPESLDAYTRSSRLYVEFCAHLERSIADISDVEFYRFEDALLGLPFPNAKGEWVRMVGKKPRGARTADLMLSLIYSVARDIEYLYGVRFDWRRYGGLPRELGPLLSPRYGRHQFVSFPRTHSIKWPSRKIVGLPDDQFIKLIQGARRRWANHITDGDIAYALDQEAQRGALFFRNTAVLFVLRYAGSRRREVVTIRFCDVDRTHSKLYLVTKGHGGEDGNRLPVILFPFVDAIIWQYATKYRPDVEGGAADEREKVFLSHSVRNYGQPITPQTVRKLIDILREELDPPWNECLTPHMLRHSFGYHIQRAGGSAAQVANMRHASINSGTPYSAGIENFLDDVADPVNNDIKRILRVSGMLELFDNDDEKI